MFAYCNNTPINGFDPCGTCYHSSDLTINCHMCKDRPIDESITGIREVTDEISVALLIAASNAESYKSQSKSLRSEVAKYLEFYDLVNHYAPCDIKRKESWIKTIGTAFPGSNTVVLYCGKAMTPEDLGNFTYGFLGHAYGISLEILYMGSYYAADFPIRGPALDNEKKDRTYIEMGYVFYTFRHCN